VYTCTADSLDHFQNMRALVCCVCLLLLAFMCGLMFSSWHPPAPPSFINLKKASLADHLKRTPPPRVPSTLGCVSLFRHLLLLSETELFNRFLNTKTAPEAIPVWRALRWKGLDTTAFIRTHQDSYPPPPPLPVDCSHIFLGMFSVFFVSCAFLVLLLVAACCRKSENSVLSGALSFLSAHISAFFLA